LTTSDFARGAKDIDTIFPILVFPLVFFHGFTHLKNISKSTVLKIYSLAIASTCFCISGILLYRKFVLHDQVNYFFLDLAGIINMHPGYLGVFVGFGIMLFVIQFDSFSWQMKIVVFFCVCILVVFELLLVSRSPLLSLIICLFVYFLLTRKVMFIIASIVIGSAFYFSGGIRSLDWSERVISPISYLLTGNWESLQLSSFYRIMVFNCSLEVLKPLNALLLGHVTGDDNQALFDCY
jgi:hypothetical protein